MEAAQESINSAFAKDAKLRKRVFDAINDTPQYLSLFHDIANFQLANAQPSTTPSLLVDGGAHPSKKRKLENGAVTNSIPSEQPRSVVLEARDLSFTLPQRKKLHLSIVQYGQDFSGSNTTFSLCLRNPATNEVEAEVPFSSFAYALKVPVPEKAQKSYNFCFLPPTQPTATDNPSPVEAVVWSVNDGPLKSCSISSPDLQAAVGTDDILDKALDNILQRTANKITVPTESEFASAIPEAHRKNQKAYHVKAHRGSKDGYLFFLESGIFFGFKKPLTFFPFHDIESVSYTAVLQRTFNLIITIQSAQVGDVAESQEIEFAMLDQADFAGIDAYIKKHQLQDASLADARRAKQYKVNGKVVTQGSDGDGQSELQKAEAEIQEDEEDEEDAMEEDYDPGSEGDSEGSGTSEDEDEYAGADGKDLVKEELGSEAEVVSADEEEEEEGDEEQGDDEDIDDEVEEDEDEVKANAKGLPQHPTPQKSGFKPIVQSPALPIHPAGAPSFDDEDQL